MPELNEYHLWRLEQTKKSVAYWTEHPMSPGTPKQSRKRIIDHLQGLFPDVDRTKIEKLI